jgi:hypothetical protein
MDDDAVYEYCRKVRDLVASVVKDYEERGLELSPSMRAYIEKFDRLDAELKSGQRADAASRLLH